MDLVEREAVLQSLHAQLGQAASSGRIVLIGGEAGVGKTSVLRALAAGHPDVWWGACDALQTPHPLAPLLDIAHHAGVRFAAHLAGPRPALFEAVLDELRLAAATVLVVIEDAHWADEATLDLIKFLGRRIERTRALLVVSFRDDEVTASHPLRRVIGELPAALLARIELARLSPAGVETLARRALRSPAGLFAATQGNPFFVTELLRHRVDELPRTVQDLVLARFARLDKPAQAIVRLAAIVPARIERWLVEALLAPSLNELEACLDSGLLLADATTLCFRHELARVAVESSLSPPVVQSLHTQVLRALTADGRSMPPARLVHHAALAGDEAALRRYAPAAAQDARLRGAHREAHAQYALAVQFAGALPAAERAALLEAFALECLAVGELRAAIAAREEAIELRRQLGDVAKQAAGLCRLTMPLVGVGRNADAEAVLRRALDLLQALPPGRELADAYRTQAWLSMLRRDNDEAIRCSERAIALAERFGDVETIASALNSQGSAMIHIDYEAGCALLERSRQVAREAGLVGHILNADSNLGSGSGEIHRFDRAERYLANGSAYAVERELDPSYMQSWQAICLLHLGRWDEAGELASLVLATSRERAIARNMAHLALGRLRARRGDAGVWSALDEALRLALESGHLQRLAPVRAARAEAAWLDGDRGRCIDEAHAAYVLSAERKHAWFVGELAYWLWCAGVAIEVPAYAAQPYALQIAGRWREAAAAWQALSCPYEQARALAAGDADAQREGLALFERLGARPAAEALRRRLREAGVRGVARGARPSTREQAFGLTSRELQVLQLLCEGLRNAEIAQRLCRSVRTVDHHLAAVFAKLGVDSRVAAIQAAQRAGLATQPRQSPSIK